MRFQAFRSRRVVLGFACAGMALVLASPGQASSGGQEPSSAVGVAVGSHVFSSCESIGHEFWSVGLNNGDQLVLDLNGNESGLSDTGGDFPDAGISFLPPGTDDFNWQDADPLDYSYTTGSDKERITFDASAGTGRYLIYVGCQYADGAYDFVVESDQRLARIDLVPRPTSLGLRGVLRARVVGGDGSGLTDGSLPFTLSVRVAGATHTFTSTPSAGVVSFNYALPRAARRKIAVFSISTPGNANWLGTSTGRIQVRVK